jgi:hypothetical protein
MDQERLAEWDLLVDDAIKEAEQRMANDDERAKKRAVQLGREQGYHRLALEIDRPKPARVAAGQLSLFPSDPTLFDAS